MASSSSRSSSPSTVDMWPAYIETESEDNDHNRLVEDYLERLEANKSVVKDIYAAIEPYTTSEHEPDLSAGELIVMAVLCSDKQAVTPEDVSDWVVQTFPYYLKLAKKAFFQSKSSPRVPSFFDQMFYATSLQTVNRAVLNRLYDVPVVETDTEHDKVLHVDHREGRVFLRKLLEPKRHGNFRFLDLPVEIRITIYEYVFTFPASGFGFHGLDKKYIPFSEKRLLIQRRTNLLSEPPSIKEWNSHKRDELLQTPSVVRDRYYQTEPMKKILALLRVNKQIYKEAMPYFYRCNHFHVDDFTQMDRLLRLCGAERRKHFTSISFWYRPWRAKALSAQCFGYLHEINDLRFLQIEADETDFTRGMPPAMETLKGVRVKKVEFIGLCPGFKKYLKETMEQPKVLEEVATKKRKRGSKTAAGEIEEGGEVAEDSDAKAKEKPRKVAMSHTSLGYWVLSCGKQKTALGARLLNPANNG